MAVDLKAALTKKLGPLPAWGWGLVLGGGYLGYRVLSGKGLSVSGSSSGNAVEETPQVFEDTAGVSSGAGYSYGSGGGAPVTIINQIPTTDSSNLASELAKSQAYAQKMKERGDNWADWGAKWKAIAKARGTEGRTSAQIKAEQAANAAFKAKHSKTGATTTNRVGTQGTQIATKKVSQINRQQATPKVPLSQKRTA